MKKLITQSQILLFALVCTIQLSVNTFCMQNCVNIVNEEPLRLIPEIEGKIATIILNLYLNELEDTINNYETNIQPRLKWGMGPFTSFLYKKNDNKLIDKMMYWIEHTRPVQEYINLNSTSYKKNTILYHATNAASEYDNTTNNMFQLTRYLLTHNANPNIQNDEGITAFFICIKSLECISFQTNKDKTREQELVTLFLNAKADPTICSRNNNFMCILADKKYSKTITNIIQASNIKDFVNKKDRTGETPAMHAVHVLNIEFLHILANAGADFNIKNARNQTSLDYALEYRQDHLMETIFGAERIEAAIKFLQDITKTNNQ